jgi:hypothetical protein
MCKYCKLRVIHSFINVSDGVYNKYITKTKQGIRKFYQHKYLTVPIVRIVQINGVVHNRILSKTGRHSNPHTFIS